MEVRLKTPEKYRFPAFETLQWYAAKFYTQRLKDSNANRQCQTLKFYNCLKVLHATLKKWINSKDYYQTHDYEIPPRFNCDKLVKIMSKELSKAELLLKSNGFYKTTKSTSTWDSSQMFMDPTTTKIETSEKSEPTTTTTIIENMSSVQPQKKPKEVLNFTNMNDLEIKLDPIDTAEVTVSPKAEAVRPAEAEQGVNPPKNEKKEEGSVVGGSLKLKLKVVKSAGDEIVVQVAKPLEASSSKQTTSQVVSSKSSEKIDDLIKKSDNEEEAINNGDDDELIRDLKNSYQDNEFVYPSLKKTKSRSRPGENEENEEDVSKTSGRKRKIKPHAAQYLEPPKPAKSSSKTSAETAVVEPAKKIKKKNHLDQMIEKNLKNVKSKEAAAAQSARNRDDDKDFVPDQLDDADYDVDDEDEDDVIDDEDADFKLKCKNNLKLSKKIKNKQLKQSKKNKESAAGESGAESSKKPKDHAPISATNQGTTTTTTTSSKAAQDKKSQKRSRDHETTAGQTSQTQ